MRPHRVLFIALIILLDPALSAGAAARGDHLLLKNSLVLRDFVFDGHIWRTDRFARADGSDSLATQSDEMEILNLDDSRVTLDDYVADGDVARDERGETQALTMSYRPRPDRPLPAIAPQRIVIRYALAKGEPHLRKTITLFMRGGAIDRLEVERFSVGEPAGRGGRGEPVFVNNAWFFGVEYPAAYSRRTDGNTPLAGSGPYDRFGNYSQIDLDGRDVTKTPRAGLIRLMHFPGAAQRQPDGTWTIVSKTAVAGVGKPGDSVELAFEDYLDAIRRPVRSFVHYNNWFDAEGKRLTADTLVNHVYLPFKRHLDPFGVHVDAIVPDDGWQDKESIYQPNPRQFPHGLQDMVALSDALHDAGTGMGLWIALNGYNSDVDWGVARGYPEALRNERFKRFKRYYSITDSHYDQTIRQRLTDLIQQCHIQYFKHDFNDLCDLSDHGHLPDDRHGHEASVDEELSLLALERQLDPQVYQNITNWIWFSPWWLQHGNNLWMLSSDSGDFLGYPEISALLRATIYRDVNLYQVWHDPGTRPLVPISHLMTHGIIYTKSKYAGGNDSLRDFGDYVMMYYMRGVQLKEWYINPNILSDRQWAILGRATRWSQENLRTLANTVYVGGDPRKGEPYGYVAWNGERGILSVRNPSAGVAEMTVPFDQTVWYRGPLDQPFRASVIYPYQGPLNASFRSGKPMRFRIPAYTVMVMRLEPGAAVTDAPGAGLSFIQPVRRPEDSTRCRVDLPNELMQRCDLLMTAHYPPRTKPITLDGPTVQIDGAPAKPARVAHGLSWVMLSFDLLDRRGRTVELSIPRSQTTTPPPERIEASLILDRPIRAEPSNDDPRLPEPLGQGFSRQSVQLFPVE